MTDGEDSSLPPTGPVVSGPSTFTQRSGWGLDGGEADDALLRGAVENRVVVAHERQAEYGLVGGLREQARDDGSRHVGARAIYLPIGLRLDGQSDVARLSVEDEDDVGPVHQVELVHRDGSLCVHDQGG